MTRPVDPNEAYPPGLLDKILAELKHTVRKDHFETWFRGISLRAIEGERYVFGVPSGFVRDWLRKNYQSQIESAIKLATGRRRCEIVLQLAREANASRVDPGAAAPLAVDDGPDEASGFGPMPGPDADDGVDPVRYEGPQRRVSEGHASAGHDSHGYDSRGYDSRGDGSRGDGSRGDGSRGDGAAVHDAGFHPIPTRPRNHGVEDGRAPGDGLTNGRNSLDGPASGGGSGRPRIREGRYSGSGWDRLSDLGELNRSYTFDQFVIGPCNRLSHAAALAVAENPGRTYNPMFIHGNVGLGKTHLLQAICHEIRRKNERARVLYLSCEEFTNRFIHAIQAGRLDEFRELHRSVDAMVVDDVQFLANKDKTQDEFFHTFNALYNTNRQIIISSDRSPSDIPTIEERLVSRFRWGLVAEMERPCFETRVAIVRRKAKLRQLEIPDDVAYFIAERIESNVRELEGAVVKVVGVASITDRDVSVELAEEALRGVVVQRSRQVTMSEIMGLVTEEFSISARDMIGKSRTQTISLPRQICMFLCRQLTDQSLEEIGRYFGGRDHTTVLYSVKKIEKRLKDDRMFRELVGTLNTRLHN